MMVVVVRPFFSGIAAICWHHRSSGVQIFVCWVGDLSSFMTTLPISVLIPLLRRYHGDSQLI
jgi:hypothetical protein